VRTAVLGIGNLLLADEGVGVHAVRALAAAGAPRECEIVEVGTALLDALPAIERAERLVVVDAMRGGGVPGTVYRLDGAHLERNRCLASLHGFDLTSVLALAGRETAPDIVIFGVEPGLIDWSLELSAPVREALPALLAAVRGALAAGPVS